jgi:iron(III) transport system substrate-binding protein
VRLAGIAGLALTSGGLAAVLQACGAPAAAPTPVPAAKPTAAPAAPSASASAAPAGAPSAAPAAKPSPSPAAAAAAGSPDLSGLYDAAKKEAKLVWWTGQFELAQAEAVIAAFKAKYPGIDVDLLRQTSQVIYQRTAQDFKAGANTVDVVGTADEANFTDLKKQGALAQYKPMGIEVLPAQYQNIDKDDTYVTSALGLVVVNYNSKLVTDPPKTWEELLDPKWANKITLGHPGFSGFVGNWAIAVTQKYGQNYFKDLAKLNPKIGRSVNDTIPDLASGERQVGSGAHSVTQARKASGDPLDTRTPDDFTVLILGPSAIMKSAPHPNAARLFQNFTFSKEYSQVLSDTFQPSLRADVSSKTGLDLDKIKTVQIDVGTLSKELPGVIDSWRQAMGV